MVKRKRDDDTAMGCIVYAVLGLLLMPIVGLFLVCSKDPENTFRRRFRLVGTKGTFEIMPMERFDKQDFTARFFFKEDNEFFTAGEHIVNYGITRDRYEIQLAELAAILRGTGKDSFTRQHDYLVHKVSLAASGCIPWK